jgi:prephenate dehydrogenase
MSKICQNAKNNYESSFMMFKKVYIFGLGMMGASLAKAIRYKKISNKIYGHDINKKNLFYAKKNNIINELESSDYKLLSESDFIILCTPISAYKSSMKIINKYKKDGAIITDIGSTKESIDILSKKIFANHNDIFIGSHPLTGKEISSITNSDKDIFNNQIILLTPNVSTKKSLINKVTRFWKSLGCKTRIIDTKLHDDILSITSHLPHLVSFALVKIILSKKSISKIEEYTGGGFRDFARLAHSDAKMWEDICSNNPKNIVSSLDKIITELNSLKSNIKNKKFKRLANYFNQTKLKLEKK